MDSPRNGELFRIKAACCLKYKCAIKQAMCEYEDRFDDELYEHFIRKAPSEFWKCWNRKFNRNRLCNQPQHINGKADNIDLANEFAHHFGEVYFDSNLDTEAHNEFSNEYLVVEQLQPGVIDVGVIDVELVDKCLHNIKMGKACGPDGLSCESLSYAHPKLIILLCTLFRSIWQYISMYHSISVKALLSHSLKIKLAMLIRVIITALLRSYLSYPSYLNEYC
jgi:hypothetical protein